MMEKLEFFRLQTRQEVLALYPRFAPVRTEEVDLAAAVGRILAAPVPAPEDVPGFPRATMDGYAVAARDTAALLSAMKALARFADKHPELDQIELNPLLLYEKGLFAVDVRIFSR